MIPAQSFWQTLREKNFFFFSGVPCSILTQALAGLAAEPDLTYVPAVREDVALGVASGAQFAGCRAAVLLQNSGLGNLVNPLTSFSLMYEVPVLLFITWRGYQGKDAPEHILMGEKMAEFLDTMGVPWAVLEDDNLEECLDQAIEYMDSEQKPSALIIRKGMIQ